jgi:hypothetical protein
VTNLGETSHGHCPRSVGIVIGIPKPFSAKFPTLVRN